MDFFVDFREISGPVYVQSIRYMVEKKMFANISHVSGQ